MTRYIDIHCHLPFPQFDKDREEVLMKMREQGIAAVVIGVDRKSSEEAVRFAEAHENIWATVGLHPADNTKESFDADFYGELVKSEKVRMVGECGLDYHHGKGDEEHKRQRKEFEKQIAFALSEDLPLMLHIRDPLRRAEGEASAHRDALALLESYAKEAGEKLRGNAHFFTGTLSEARRYWNIGFSTSFPGVITFTDEYNEVVKGAPKELILSETDSPYASPVPLRGKRNDPSNVLLVVEKMAEIRGEEISTLRSQLLKNAGRLLREPSLAEG